MSVLGPNTNLDASYLQSNVLLCCGEDSAEFLAAIQIDPTRKVERHWSYRCYQFWQFPGLLAAWGGIGTGCLEPMLYELLTPQKVKQIALVGTAGKFAHSKVGLTETYLCDPAKCSFTGMDRIIGDRIMHPKLPAKVAGREFPKAGILSTDLFYGFSPLVMRDDFPLYHPSLAKAFHDESSRMDLIDMEVGQFYFLCEKYGRNSLDAYLAFKAAANEMGQGDQQLENSQSVLNSSVAAALDAMGYEKS